MYLAMSRLTVDSSIFHIPQSLRSQGVSLLIRTNGLVWHLVTLRPCKLKGVLETRQQVLFGIGKEKKRITASNFGRLMLRKADVTDKFINSILEPKPFTAAATTYGTKSEKIAKNMYRKKTGNHVHDCGLLVNPKYTFIAASPDAKVCENGQSGILEVKSPFSIRDWNINQALESYEKEGSLFLENVGTNNRLKRNHLYWFQVQGQLLVSGAKYCDFVTYTKKDLLVERIVPDEAEMTNILKKLCDVFINHVAQKLDK